MIIWLIGMMFTLGLLHEEMDSAQKEGGWKSIQIWLIIIFLWPFSIGFFVRDCVDEYNKSQEDK